MTKNANDAEENARLAKVLKLTEKELKNTVAKLLKTEDKMIRIKACPSSLMSTMKDY